MSPDELCALTASTQYGLLSAPQAHAAGLSKHGISFRVRTARWVRLLPEVFLINGAPDSWHRQAMAACLWARDMVAVSHRAAARLWGLRGFGSAPVEISAYGNHRSDDLGFRTHRVSRHLVSEIVAIDSLPVTSVRRTLLDVAGIKHPRLEAALDQALIEKMTSLGELWLLYKEDWTRGRRGIAILRSHLITRTPGRAPTESDLERMLTGIVRDYALPEPTRQYPIDLPDREIRVDFSFPESRLIIETDSYAFHGGRKTFDSDRARDNELQAMGWRVLRFTWAQMKWRPEWSPR